jgi:hypothetical protein
MFKRFYARSTATIIGCLSQPKFPRPELLVLGEPLQQVAEEEPRLVGVEPVQLAMPSARILQEPLQRLHPRSGGSACNSNTSIILFV